MRRLAADYAYDFERLAAFFAGNPAEAAAWPDAIARAQAHPRAARPRGRGRPAATGTARRAPRGAGGGCAAGRPANGRHRHRAAGGAVRRSAVHAAQGAHRPEAGRPASAASTACRPSPIFWTDAEDHDWAEVASCAVLDADMRRRTMALGTPPSAPASSRSRPFGSTRRSSPPSRGCGSCCPPPSSPTSSSHSSAEAYRPGASDVGGVRPVDRDAPRSARPRRLRLRRAGDQAARARGLRARARIARPNDQAGGGQRARRSSSLGYHAQVVPHDDNVALFRLDDVRQPIHFRDEGVRRRRRPFPANDLLEEARAHPEGFSPNVLLRPIVQDTLFPTDLLRRRARTSWRTSAQLRPIYERFGVPAPLMYPRASATLLDSASARLPGELPRPARVAAARRRGGVEPPARDAAAGDASRRRSHEATRAVDTAHGAADRGRAGDRPDAGRRGALVAGPDAARSADAAREDHPRGQAPRRNAAAAILADPGAGVSRRPPAGAQRRPSCTS